MERRRALNAKQIVALTEMRGEAPALFSRNRCTVTPDEWDSIKKLRKKEKKKTEKFEFKDIVTKSTNILVYDIETSRVRADVWGAGKQFVTHSQLRSETTIISIAWKFAGDDKVKYLTWDENKCDKKMVKEFLKIYNKADMVVGQNNNSFDNKLINTRAAKHGLFVDRFVKSFDIYRMAKKYFRLQSYSMAFMAKYFGLTLKQSHEGIHMWDMIEYGNKEEHDEYLGKMVAYNKGDIVTTEELFMKLKPYFSTVMNSATAKGKPRWACPVSSSENVKLLKTVYTELGTVNRILYCSDSNHQYRVSNRVYEEFIQR